MIRRSTRIAVYLSNDGEIDLGAFCAQAWQQGKQLYLPVLDPLKQGHLQFFPFTPNTKLRKNRYNIAEPVTHGLTPIEPWALDSVLTPLVGFDRQGNRMGMGGGYYDRTFDFMLTEHRPRKPLLIGTAHTCQETAELEQECWDIPMNWIATDSGIYPCR